MENRDIVKEFITGGWIVTLLGAAGMVARLLINDEHVGWKDIIRRILAAAICSTVTWCVMEQFVDNSLIKAVAYGVVGVISPEIVSGVVRLAKKVGNNPLQYFKK